tara:strand:+ start:312 stop:704 length:393 start_codon:yes stop_codon:yes gene_type:complete
MGKVGKFIHSAVGTKQGAAMGNTYDVNNRVDFNMGSASFRGRLSAIYFDGTIAGGATKLTIKVFSDATGTGRLIVPQTECTLTTDISGSGGGAVVELEVDLVMSSGTFSMFGFTDAGTFEVTSAQITWEE